MARLARSWGVRVTGTGPISRRNPLCKQESVLSPGGPGETNPIEAHNLLQMGEQNFDLLFATTRSRSGLEPGYVAGALLLSPRPRGDVIMSSASKTICGKGCLISGPTGKLGSLRATWNSSGVESGNSLR